MLPDEARRRADEAALPDPGTKSARRMELFVRYGVTGYRNRSPAIRGSTDMRPGW